MTLRGQTYSHSCAHGRSGRQACDAGTVGRVREEHSQRDDVGSHQAAVDRVATGNHDGSGVENSLKLSVGHDRPAEGHASDVGSEEESDLLRGGGRVSFEVREVVDVGGDAGEDCGNADQRMEGGDQLGKVGDLDAFSDGSADGSAT